VTITSIRDFRIENPGRFLMNFAFRNSDKLSTRNHLSFKEKKMISFKAVKDV